MPSKQVLSLVNGPGSDPKGIIAELINKIDDGDLPVEATAKRYNGDYERELKRRIKNIQNIDAFCRETFKENEPEDLKLAHKLLSKVYDLYFKIPSLPGKTGILSPEMFEVSRLIESYVCRHEDSFVPEGLFLDIPKNANKYIGWIKDLIEKHPARNHALYEQYLPEQATKEDLIFFFIQETTLDPRFDDVMAFLQIGTSDQVKMEMARNYWDEMGNGRPHFIHANLFKKLLRELNITEAKIRDNLSIEAIICGNLSAMLSLYRHNFYKAVGYFGVTEYLVADRFTQLLKAWERNNLKEDAIEYHKLHIEIDTKHSDDWYNNVIVPLVESQPGKAEQITRGIFYRLNSSQRYLDNILNYFLSK